MKVVVKNTDHTDHIIVKCNLSSEVSYSSISLEEGNDLHRHPTT